MTSTSGRSKIDLHHHFVPDGVFQRLREMAGGATRLVTEETSFTLNPDLTDPLKHLAAMDRAGVAMAVLVQSGLNFLGLEICRSINDELAEVVSRYPDRFAGCVHVPVDPGSADEIARCVEDYRFPCVTIPTSIGEVFLDDPRMDPIWEAAQRYRTPIILHPNLLPKGASTDYGLERSTTRTTDTTMAAVRIMCGVFDRYPELIFVLPHCGGTLGWLKGRIAMFFDEPPGQRPPELRGYALTASQQRQYGFADTFEERFHRFYVDTAGTGAWHQAIKMTAEVFGPDRMVCGSDYPLEAKTPEEMAEVLDAIYQVGLSPEQLRMVESETAQHLLARFHARD